MFDHLSNDMSITETPNIKVKHFPINPDDGDLQEIKLCWSTDQEDSHIDESGLPPLKSWHN